MIPRILRSTAAALPAAAGPAVQQQPPFTLLDASL
jgi:hypothetical protein